MDIDNIIEENKLLKAKNDELEEKLKKYTNSIGHKKYYENNKEKVIKNAANYLQKLKEDNPDKIKEYAKKAYLKQKEKKKQKELINENI
jgi:hypothetical protein